MARCLVIGASRGIGLELVRQARAAGDEVVATARSEAGLAPIRALGAKALMLDVASAAGCSGLAWQIDGEAFDQAWLVAGLMGPRLAAPHTPAEADFDTVMHTNVLAAMRLLPQLTEALAPGAKLVVLSSVMGSIGQRSNGSAWLYRASKAALNSVLRDMAFTLDGRAIAVSMHPGWVQTDMGGPQAPLTVGDSVRQLRASVAGFGPADHGGFFDLTGAPLPW